MDKKFDTDCEDYLSLGPELSDGRKPYVRHLPDHGIQLGYISPPQKDDIACDEIVKLEPRDGKSLFNVTVLGHKGPANITSDAYRTNFDGIFGKAPIGQA